MTPPITRRSFLKALVIAPAVPILPTLPIELPAAEPVEVEEAEDLSCIADWYNPDDSWPIDPLPNEEDGSLCTEAERKENYRLYKASIRMSGSL